MKPGEDRWDVIVIGGGPPGETAAQYASQYSGLSIALVEQERVGGECEYWACRPSKALLMPVDTMSLGGSLPGVREIIKDRQLDVPAVLARRDTIANHYDDTPEVQWLAAHGIDLLRGRGRLSGPKSVTVTAEDGTVRAIAAQHAVILATGTSAAMPPIAGLAAAYPWTSRDVTALHEVPRRVVVIGGGPVACESVTWLRGLGAEEVTLVHRGARLLSGAEPFVGDIVLGTFRQAGITVRLNVNVGEVTREGAEDLGYGNIHGGPAAIRLDNGDRLEVDEIVVATGRRPNSDDLGLDTVGVTTSHGYVEVDDHLTVAGTDWLYVVGDLTGRALMTHMGKYQARVAGEVIAARALGRPLTEQPFNEFTSIADGSAVPQVVFAEPHVASVGLTEAQARDRGIDVETAEYDLAAIAGAEIQRENYEGRAKLVVDQGTDTVIGATFIGGGTAELLHSATVAIVGKLPTSALWHAVPSFPTVSEIWLRLLETLRQQRHKG